MKKPVKNQCHYLKSVTNKTNFSNNDPRNNNFIASKFFYREIATLKKRKKKERKEKKGKKLETRSTHNSWCDRRAPNPLSQTFLVDGILGFWRNIYHIRRIKRVRAVIKEFHGAIFHGKIERDRFVVLSSRLSYRILRGFL